MPRPSDASDVTSRNRLIPQVLLLVLLGGFTLSGRSAGAAIIGINTPATSFATILFDDTNSNGPPLGVTSTGPSVPNWNGSLVTLPLTTDPNTSDFASGDLVASFVPASNLYSLSFSNIALSQPLATTTGMAVLVFNFSVEYQLDAAGLPLQGTLFPTFVLSGTVQTPPGSFAVFSGSLDYSGVTISGAVSQIEFVSYSASWTSPGAFSATVAGTPTFGFTPALMPNTFLRIDGSFKFVVDPATIQGYGFTPVPEPSTWGLLAIGAAFVGCATRRSGRHRKSVRSRQGV